MDINVHDLMAALGRLRPIFHSEADFQHALGWELHRRLPEWETRLELPLEIEGRALHLDVLLTRQAQSVTIELKYKVRALSTVWNGEHFSLKDQAAQDLGRYDFLKDVQRVERISASRPGTRGYAILLTNDGAYWKRSTMGDTVDAAFRLPEGRMVHGRLAWGAAAAPGTIRSREEPIELAGTYHLEWRDYSRLSASTYGGLRYLSVATS